MNDLTNALVEELESIWGEVKDVDPAELDLAKSVARDAAQLGAAAVLGQLDTEELEIVKATKDQLSATAAKRAQRVARLAVSRVVDRLLGLAIGAIGA
jgi:hypothetical protein